MSSSKPFAFRIPKRHESKPSDPETLFRSLTQRSPHIQHLWAHQADVLRDWHSNYADTPNLALELPTGTGKTLIGLLIGEFVRRTRQERVAYLCPNRQLAYQVGSLAADYSIDARVLVGQQSSYLPGDFNAFEDSSAIAVTTYAGLFNINPKINSANLLILDDAHASEDFIASPWNVEIKRHDEREIYHALLDFFKGAIPGYRFGNLKNDSISYSIDECTKIPSRIMQNQKSRLRELLDEAVSDKNQRYSWSRIRGHLDACHTFVTWSSISIRPISPPTFDHPPFANARQRIFMSATLGEGGELERITGVRKIERLPVPEGWDKEGTGRRFIMFPERSLTPEIATTVAISLVGDSIRSLILAPNRYQAQSVTDNLDALSPSPAIFSAHDIEDTLDPFLKEEHAALVLHNRYDGLDLPGDMCRLEWISGLPAATSPQETFLLNRLGLHSLLRDRIRTRLTQALGRCTRSPTDHAVVLMSGSRALDFCIRSENRSGFHPELQAEIEYGLDMSKDMTHNEFLAAARAFLRKEPGWEAVDEWIRGERDSYKRKTDEVSQTLMANVLDEVDYATCIWVGNYRDALKNARACADRLGGDALANYRAWWYYLAGSAAVLSARADKSPHLQDVAREMFNRACSASSKSTWFWEALRHSGVEVSENPVDDLVLLFVAETIENRIQSIGIAGAGFEKKAKAMIENLNSSDSTPFEQGLKQLGFWLGVDAKRPKGTGVPDGIWVFPDELVVVFEAKSNEDPKGSISLNTARQAQGHLRWVTRNGKLQSDTPITSVVISDREMVASDALPSAKGLFVVGLTAIRELGQKVVSTIRSLRVEASETSSEEFRRVIVDRLKDEKLDPASIQAALQLMPLDGLHV